MKIVIFAKRARTYTVQRIADTARVRGHVCHVVDPDDCTLFLDEDRPQLYSKSRRLLTIDCALARLGSTAISDFTLSILSTLDTLGVPCLNSYEAVQRGRDKFRSLTLIAAGGVAIPKTILARRPEEVERKIELLGGPPIILKIIHGTQGVGLIFAEKLDSIVSILESFWEVGKNIILQELVPESRERDIRAFVIGGEVVAAMRRIAPVGEFREAVDRASRVDLAPAYRDAALRAARLLGLEVATVDLIETRRGPLVTDIGWSPNLEIVESVTGIDVAAAIVEHAEMLAQKRRRGVPGLARTAALR